MLDFAIIHIPRIATHSFEEEKSFCYPSWGLYHLELHVCLLLVSAGTESKRLYEQCLLPRCCATWLLPFAAHTARKCSAKDRSPPFAKFWRPSKLWSRRKWSELQFQEQEATTLFGKQRPQLVLSIPIVVLLPILSKCKVPTNACQLFWFS